MVMLFYGKKNTQETLTKSSSTADFRATFSYNRRCPWWPIAANQKKLKKQQIKKYLKMIKNIYIYIYSEKIKLP